MVPNKLHKSFATAYGFWRGVGPRGNALFLLAQELAKRPEFGLGMSERTSSVIGSDALAIAVLMLDEAWRRQYATADVTDDVLEELLSATRLNRLSQPAFTGESQPLLKDRFLNRHAELERVCLTHPVSAFYEPGDAGFSTNKDIPAGAEGTILTVLGEGQGYEVEFAKPFAAIATVKDGDLR